MPPTDEWSTHRLDKNRIAADAQKFSAKGQFDKAIAEYEKITLAEPQNLRALLKIADLQVRLGDPDLAVTSYNEIARIYVDAGFSVKAEAVLQRVVALKPELMDIHLWLAELKFERGLLGDVRLQFEAALQAYEDDAHETGAIELLQAIADLDPNHVASHLHMAELYARSERTAEAIAQFSRASDLLRTAGRTDAFIVVAERLLDLQPENLALTRELAEVFVQGKYPRRAIGPLQTCYDADPTDVETLALLVRTFLELGQKPRAIASLRSLAEVYATMGSRDLERDALQRIQQLAPEEPEATVARSATGVPASAMRKDQEPAALPADPPPAQEPKHAEVELLDLPELDDLMGHPQEPEPEPAPPPQVQSLPTAEPASQDVFEPLDLAIEIEAMVEHAPEEEAAALFEEAKIYAEFGLYKEAADQLDRAEQLSPGKRESQRLQLQLHEQAQAAADAARSEQAKHVRDSVRRDGGLAELLEPNWDSEEHVVALTPVPKQHPERDGRSSEIKKDEPTTLDEEFDAAFFRTPPPGKSD